MIRFKINENGIKMHVSEATPIYKEGSGENGATFFPTVSPEGVLSWENDKGLENPEPVNIKGEKGDKGDPGDDYVLTEADKTEIAEIAISKLPVYNGEVSEV